MKKKSHTQEILAGVSKNNHRKCPLLLFSQWAFGFIWVATYAPVTMAYVAMSRGRKGIPGSMLKLMSGWTAISSMHKMEKRWL
jgi:hypothetical protein